MVWRIVAISERQNATCLPRIVVALPHHGIGSRCDHLRQNNKVYSQMVIKVWEINKLELTLATRRGTEARGQTSDTVCAASLVLNLTPLSLSLSRLLFFYWAACFGRRGWWLWISWRDTVLVAYNFLDHFCNVVELEKLKFACQIVQHHLAVVV